MFLISSLLIFFISSNTTLISFRMCCEYHLSRKVSALFCLNSMLHSETILLKIGKNFLSLSNAYSNSFISFLLSLNLYSGTGKYSLLKSYSSFNNLLSKSIVLVWDKNFFKAFVIMLISS